MTYCSTCVYVNSSASLAPLDVLATSMCPMYSLKKCSEFWPCDVNLRYFRDQTCGDEDNNVSLNNNDWCNFNIC